MLLNMLKISPFTYGLDILNIYDNGTVFDPAILDITDDDIRGRFMSGVNNIAAVSLAIGYPTVASVPHSIANSFKNLAAIAAATDIAFPQVDALKDSFKNFRIITILINTRLNYNTKQLKSGRFVRLQKLFLSIFSVVQSFFVLHFFNRPA